MVETQSNPQFIFWVKEAGVFRPAQLTMPKDYVGYDLERNVKLGSQDISPHPLSLISHHALTLVSSVYLGPINIFQEPLSSVTGKEAFQRYQLFPFRILSEIVAEAKDVAQQQGVPYFALGLVQTGKDRTRRFITAETDESLMSPFNSYKPNNFGDYEKLTKPLEFVLHPTAQLYVAKK